MKNYKILSLLWVVLLAWTLAGCGNSQTAQPNNWNNWDIIIEEINNNDVVSYNDNLVSIAEQCFQSEEGIWVAYQDSETTVEDIQNAINSTTTACRESINNLNTLWGWEGDSSLKDGIVSILEKDIQYYEKFSELLPYVDNTEELTEEQAAAYDSIVAEINSIDDELSVANEELMTIQENFANAHGYELNPSEEQA